MTRPGRDLQDQISDNLGDWADKVSHVNHRLQSALRQVQTVLERADRSLQQVAE